jgi:hypothetical protein
VIDVHAGAGKLQRDVAWRYAREFELAVPSTLVEMFVPLIETVSVVVRFQ